MMNLAHSLDRRIAHSEAADNGRDGIAGSRTPDVDVGELEASLKRLRSALDAEAKTFAVLRKPGVTPEELQAFYDASLELRKMYAESLKLETRAPVILADPGTPRHGSRCSESRRSKRAARRDDDEQG